MQRSAALFALALVLFASVAWADADCPSGSAVKADAAQPATQRTNTTDLPVYTGATPVMEINVGVDDMLPAFQTAVPLASRLLGKSLNEKDSAEVVKAMEDVTHVSAIQWDIPASKATDTDIIRFLADKRPDKDYTRVLAHTNKTIGILNVYSKPGGQSLYIFHISTVDDEAGAKIKRVEVARIEGRVEYARLIPIMQRLLQ